MSIIPHYQNKLFCIERLPSHLPLAWIKPLIPHLYKPSSIEITITSTACKSSVYNSTFTSSWKAVLNRHYHHTYRLQELCLWFYILPQAVLHSYYHHTYHLQELCLCFHIYQKPFSLAILHSHYHHTYHLVRVYYSTLTTNHFLQLISSHHEKTRRPIQSRLCIICYKYHLHRRASVFGRGEGCCTPLFPCSTLFPSKGNLALVS